MNFVCQKIVTFLFMQNCIINLYSICSIFNEQ